MSNKSNQQFPRCAYCFQKIGFIKSSERVDHVVHEAGSSTLLQWHDDNGHRDKDGKTCADKDTLLEEIANAEGVIVVDGNGERTLKQMTVLEQEQVYVKALARLHERVLSDVGEKLLPDVFQVRKDYNSPRITLRGKGALWGMPSFRDGSGAAVRKAPQ